MQPPRGDLLADRYRLVEPRGRGGMAVVWESEDEVLHRRVAVKIMAAHLLDDPSALARFRREGRAAARLNHPNVVALYDAVSDGDVHFLVMELLEAGSLADRLRQGPLAPPAALEVLDQVAAGLGAAHEHGLVHRDVKPSNILYATDGTAKVADFGIATAVAASATMTHTVHGSVPYLAPEQATGATPDPRTDLYALGCMAHEMLTGAPPFAGDTAAAVISQHLHADPPSLSVGGIGGIAGGLQAVIHRLMAKDPADRHATAAALREDLARVRRGEPPVVAAPAPEAGARGRNGGDGASTGRDAPTTALPGVTPTADRSAPTLALDSTATLGPAPGDPAAPTAEPSEDRRRWWWLLVPAVLVVGLLAASVLDDGDDEIALADAVTAVTASPTASPSAPASPTPTAGDPTPAPPSPTAEAPAAPSPSLVPAPPPPPTTPAAPTTPATTAPTEPAGPSAETTAAIAAIRDLVADGLERGQLDDEGAAAIEAALEQPRDVDGLRATVASLVEDGHANPGLGNQLDAAIDDLAATYA